MTRLIAWALKHPKIAVIIILSTVTTVGGYIGYNMVTISRLETRVAVLEKSVDDKNDQIADLESSVLEQNAEVEQWRQAAQARQEAAQEAQRQARAARREADETIGRIKALNPQSCEEGIDLINREVIGL